MLDSMFLVGGFAAGSLEASYQRAFAALGVATPAFDLLAARGQLHWLMRNRVAHRLTIRSRAIRQACSRKLNAALRDAVLASKARAMLILKGDLVMPQTLRDLRHRGVRIALFHPDNPLPGQPNNCPETLPAARETDVYLIWSERLVEKLRAAGVPNPRFLPFAWDAQVFPYQPGLEQGTWPGVLFLGGWGPEREAFLEELAAAVPLRIFGPDYWGTRTARAGRVRRCWQGADLRMAAAARAIRESAVSLNILRQQHYIDGVPDGLIMRHFEVPGAGGFLLSTRSGGATRLFPEHQTGAYFSDVKECIEQVRRYLADAPARLKLVQAAHDAVATEHQYTDRAREILHLLEL